MRFLIPLENHISLNISIPISVPVASRKIEAFSLKMSPCPSTENTFKQITDLVVCDFARQLQFEPLVKIS